MRIKIDFDSLGYASSSAKGIGDSLGEYRDCLNNSLYPMYGELTGESHGYSSTSAGYVNGKIACLNVKRNRFYNSDSPAGSFAQQLDDFSEFASTTDSDIAFDIRINKYDMQSALGIESAWYDYVGELWNSFVEDHPILDAISEWLGDRLEDIGNWFESVQEWYVLGGGREVWGVVKAVLGIVAAVAGLVVSIIAVCNPVGAIIFAIIGVVGAVIAVVSAVVNLSESIKATQTDNPTWARIHENTDSLQDLLRITKFDTAAGNKASYYWATGIDCVKLVCDVVGFANFINNIGNVSNLTGTWKTVSDICGKVNTYSSAAESAINITENIAAPWNADPKDIVDDVIAIGGGGTQIGSDRTGKVGWDYAGKAIDFVDKVETIGHAPFTVGDGAIDTISTIESSITGEPSDLSAINTYYK